MSATKYDIEVDLGAPDTSHRHMVEMIGSNKKVLDVGCATGYLAKTLRAFGNCVTGVEFDPKAAEMARQYAEKVHVADLDSADLALVVAGEKFDVIVFGDVLEHLRDPLPPLRQAKSLLAPGGYIVISIPNVAHGDVRMSLLLGRFTYRNLGLLDNTHLRFFTRENLRELLTDAGFVAVEVRNTTAPLFGTELGVRSEEVSPEVVAMISADPDALVYQFVVTAVPRDATALAADAAWQAQQNRLRLSAVEAELAALEGRFAQVKADLNAAQEVNVQLQAQLDAMVARAEAAALVQRELDALRATKTLRTRSATLRMMGRG
jgi:2-polyprenyl-3-methyl-5-hydroxy-6-metoxy-1,4-benzoquinol methylase